MDFLIDGQISSFCSDLHGGEAFNPNNATQTHSLFVKRGVIWVPSINPHAGRLSEKK